jgi:hypothetical protein
MLVDGLKVTLLNFWIQRPIHPSIQAMKLNIGGPVLTLTSTVKGGRLVHFINIEAIFGSFLGTC